MRRRQNLTVRLGPPFVEVDGRLYLNLGFDLEPFGPELRERVLALVQPARTTGKLMVLRRLTVGEVKVVRERRRAADIEAWAMLTAVK